MKNDFVDEVVDQALLWVVYRAVDGTLDGETFTALTGPVYWTVSRVVKWAVILVIGEGRSPPHPGLGLYLDAEGR